MYPAELSIHLSKKVIPTVCLTKYTGAPEFTTVKILSEGSPTVTFFTDKLSNIVALKNNMLWAFEKYIKEQTP